MRDRGRQERKILRAASVMKIWSSDLPQTIFSHSLSSWKIKIKNSHLKKEILVNKERYKYLHNSGFSITILSSHEIVFQYTALTVQVHSNDVSTNEVNDPKPKPKPNDYGTNVKHIETLL